jgi:protocatechuate 3,4-dioxygenase beta subunit
MLGLYQKDWIKMNKKILTILSIAILLSTGLLGTNIAGGINATTNYSNSSLEGYVYDENKQPIKNARVNISSLIPVGKYTGADYTDEQGHFKIETEGITYFSIYVQKQGYYGSANFVYIASGKTTWFNFTLSHETEIGYVEGYVLKTNGKPPLMPVTIMAYTLASVPLMNATLANFTTGYFKISVPCNHYYCVIAHEMRPDTPVEMWKYGNVYVCKGETSRIDFTFGLPQPNHPNGYIEGYVLDQNHNPLENILIQTSNEGEIKEAYTDANGYYNVEVTSNYFHEVIAKPIEGNYVEMKFINNYVFPDLKNLVNFTLATFKGNGTIEGHVYNLRNKPIKGAYVGALAESSNEIGMATTTDETGYYCLDVPGDYHYAIISLAEIINITILRKTLLHAGFQIPAFQYIRAGETITIDFNIPKPVTKNENKEESKSQSIQKIDVLITIMQRVRNIISRVNLKTLFINIVK